MIVTLSVNVTTNFAISFIVNIRTRIQKSKRPNKEIQIFREDVIIQPKNDSKAPLNVTREISKTSTKFGFYNSHRSFARSPTKLSDTSIQRKSKVSRI